MQEFVQKNILNLIGVLISFVVAFTIFQGKIEANANDIEDLKDTLKQQQTLIERVIVLEERQKVDAENIVEIKTDVKDLKEHFKIAQ